MVRLAESSGRLWASEATTSFQIAQDSRQASSTAIRIVARLTGPMESRSWCDAITSGRHAAQGDRNQPWAFASRHNVGRDSGDPGGVRPAKKHHPSSVGRSVRVAGQILPGMNYKGASEATVEGGNST